MKNINSILAIFLLTVFAVSCQSDIELDNVGYLRLNIESVAITNTTKAVPENYDPKQLAVKIINANGEVVEQTDDYDEWIGRQFRLQPGSYTVEASSYGYDGLDSGFDCPYYKGSTDIEVKSETSVTANITCTLANVKVTVEWDESVLQAFQSAKAVVSSSLANVLPQEFIAGQNPGAAYFPAENLTVRYSTVNRNGESNSTDDASDHLITGLEARDHVRLVFKTAQSGTIGGVNVTVDGSTTTYTFKFNVSTEAKTSLEMRKINAWSKFAYVEAVVGALEAGKELDDNNFKFEYKEAVSTVTEWVSVNATKDGEDFKATLKSLKPNTIYVCKLVYTDGTETYASTEAPFTTENATVLYNGGFEHWQEDVYVNGNEDVPNESGVYFWDTSNPGSNKGGKVVTTGCTDIKHSGNRSAKLETKSAFSVLAAASIYSGEFGATISTKGAWLTFGRPFTDRVTQLKGYYNYIPATINKTKDPYKDLDGTPDLCSIYIALTTETIKVDNTNMSTFPDWLNDERVIAYGSLEDSRCVLTNGWQPFTIDLKYRDLEKKPTHIIVVSSSSKYGDYFTGGVGSVLYLDDFELLYDKEPVTK